MARRIVSPELIGREAELATVARALAEAEEGRGRAVLIGGEAGIGKSRVLVEATERARTQGALILVGGSIGLAEGALPFGPIVEAIRPLLKDGSQPARRAEAAMPDTAAGRADFAAVPDGLDGPLLHVASELGLIASQGLRSQETAELRPEWARSHMYEAFLELVRHLAADRVVVLAIEDLHWSDESTRELLAFLIRNARQERLLTLATFRSDELHRRHPLLPWLIEMGRLPSVERIELARLPRDGIARQVAAITGRRAEPSLVDSVYLRSEGNPLFVEELLVTGIEAEGVPPTLREVLAARLNLVSEPTLRLLGVAAVVGRRVDHELLVRIAELPDSDLDEALQEAIAAQLLVVDEDSVVERYAFRHALVAEAAAETVLPSRRRRLHAAIATALENSNIGGGRDEAGRLAEIAHHWFEAREVEPAFAASVRAGDAARDSGGYAEALRQYERALELWDVVPDPETTAATDRIELLRRGGQAAQISGAFQRAIQLLEEAIALAGERGETVRVGLLSERLGRSLWTSGAIDRSGLAYRTALELVPEQPPSADRARVLGGYAQVLMLAGHPSESKTIAEDALEIARVVGNRQIEGDVLATLGVDLGYIGDEDESIDLLRQAVAIAEEGQDLDAIGRAYANLSSVLDSAGRIPEAIDVAMKGAARMRELGWGVTYAPFVELNGVEGLLTLGRIDEALQRASELEPVAHGTSLLFANRLLAAIWTLRGEPERAAKAIRSAADALAGWDAQFTGPISATQLDLARLTGDVEAGRRVADRALPILAQTEDRVELSRVLIAAIRLEADEAERARAARETARLEVATRRAQEYGAKVRESREQARSPGGRGRLDRDLAFADAELARIAAAPNAEAWRRGRDLALRWGPAADAASATFRLAEALLAERSSRHDAATELRRAHALATELGARPLVEAIEGLAARSRVPLAAPTETAVPAPTETRQSLDSPIAAYGLSPREVEVLRLLALGRTNREIADALFISESTAGVHVSHILTKLNVDRRVEAATIAARLQLVEETRPVRDRSS